MKYTLQGIVLFSEKERRLTRTVESLISPRFLFNLFAFGFSTVSFVHHKDLRPPDIVNDRICTEILHDYCT